MKVVAFDLSLTATGVATDAGTEVLTPPKHCARDVARLRWIRGAVLDRVAAGALVVLEGYSYGSKNAREALGELGGVVRVALADAGVQFVTVQPKAVKKYATGKGNASKELMLVAAVKRLGYDGADNNEADALWMYAMALDHYGAPVVGMPITNREALASVAWPQNGNGKAAL